MNTFKIIFLLFLIPVFTCGQEVIYLDNPSFEDMPRHSRQPRGWYDCGAFGASPPDTQPGQFDVNQLPFDGDSYIGMVFRDNETWEVVSQRLESELLANQAYDFSIYLSRSELYLSPSRADSLSMINHTTPGKLRIWGGNGWCQKEELLAESTLVINTRWLEFHLEFMPSKNYNTIVFEAYYKTPVMFYYNGNILMDNASPITPIDSLKGKRITQPEPHPMKEYPTPIVRNSNTQTKPSEPRSESARPMINLNKKKPLKNSGLSDLTKLKAYISVSGEDIEFTYDEKNIISDGRRFLEKTVEKMLALDDETILIIAVYDDLKDVDGKIKIIQNFMAESDLASDEYIVRKVKKSDKLKFWQSDNGIVKIRLIRK